MTWWITLKRNRLALVAALALLLLYLSALFAEVVAPYSPQDVQKNGSLLPPTALYWTSETGSWIGLHVYPTTQGPVSLDTGDRQLNIDRDRPARIGLWVKGSPYRWLGLIPGDRHLLGTAPAPDGSVVVWNLLGTDDQGRDYFSRLIYGSRISLCVGLVGILIAFPLGMLLGGLSGYLGGLTDIVLMRLTEVLMSIPSLYLLVALAAILQTNPWTGVPFSNWERFVIIIAITSLIGWAGLARVIRGQVLSLREREYVQAAKVAGASELYILVRHILPQTTTYLIIAATLAIPGFIAAESVLSLIGLGIQQPDASWGNMLFLATNASIMVLQPWLILAPTSLIVISSLAFNILGDSLRDALDPRQQV